MMIFVDTSAIYAVFDADDANHLPAKDAWADLLRGRAALRTTNYVLLECTVLLQHRLGIAAVRAFYEDIVPLLEIDWVTPERHRAGWQALLAAGRRKLSLVDCTSFQCMREHGIHASFCFDAHFGEQGFQIVPAV